MSKKDAKADKVIKKKEADETKASQDEATVKSTSKKEAKSAAKADKA